MSERELEASIDAIARDVLFRAVDIALDHGYVEWSDYPDIGERDWDAVTVRVRELAESTGSTTVAYEAAYAHLSGRVLGPAGHSETGEGRDG